MRSTHRCATASVSLFAAGLLKRAGADEPYRFMLAAGLLSGFLMLDDLYRLHETVFPRVLGIPERLTYAAYGLLGVGFMVRFRARLLSTDGRLLVAAMACLAASVALDVLPWHGIDPYFWEDAFKVVGLAGWFFYFLSAAWRALAGGEAFAERSAGLTRGHAHARRS